MSEYDRALEQAKRQIATKGRQITLRTYTSNIDPDQPWKPAVASQVDTVVKGVFLNLSDGDISYIGGTTIPKVSQKVLIAAKDLPVVINLESVLLDGSDVWKTIKIKELKPGDTTLMYTLYIGK